MRLDEMRSDEIKVDNFLVQMQFTGNSGWAAFPWETEQPQYDVTQRFVLLPVFCFRVSIPPAVRLSPLRQMDMGSLTCAQIWMRAKHKKGRGGWVVVVKHRQVCTRVDSETHWDGDTSQFIGNLKENVKKTCIISKAVKL